MIEYIWNIYEPADLKEPGEDPFDIFLYALRREEVPQLNDIVHIEGQRKHVIAIQIDARRNETIATPNEVYYKVCVN